MTTITICNDNGELFDKTGITFAKMFFIRFPLRESAYRKNTQFVNEIGSIFQEFDRYFRMRSASEYSNKCSADSTKKEIPE